MRKRLLGVFGTLAAAGAISFATLLYADGGYFTPEATTGPTMVFVDAATGHDYPWRDCSDPFHACRTLRAAMRRVPHLIRHVVRVDVAPGDYYGGANFEDHYFEDDGLLVLDGDRLSTPTVHVGDITLDGTSILPYEQLRARALDGGRP